MTDEIENAVNQAFQRAKQYEMECTGCAQTTLAGILETIGTSNDDLFRAASGLSGGMGLSTQGTCGALMGAALVIGLIFGRKRADFQDLFAAMDSYDLVLDLVEEFEKRIGALCCKDIQTKFAGRTFNLRNPDEFAAAIEAGLREHCSNIVGTAAELATRIIMEVS